MKKLCMIVMALCAFFFLVQDGWAQKDTITVSFTSVGSASWTVPAGTQSIMVEAIGGGGAGGRATGSGFRFRCAAGGSGAAYAMKELGQGDFTPGETFAITVGAAGNEGVNGTASVVTLNETTLVSAAGGVSIVGNNNQTGAVAQPRSASVGDVIHIGGNGSSSAGDNSLPLFVSNAGGGGGAGGSLSDGGNATAATTSAGGGGDGGSGGGALRGGYPAGNGGSGTGTWSDVPQGHNGSIYGGGGSGAWATGWGNHAGGSGAQGIVVITYVMTLEIEDTTATICSGNTFQITPEGVIPEGTLYNWEAPSVEGITGAEAGSGQTSVSGTLTNTTAADIQVNYQVTASNGTYTDLFTVTVTVLAMPEPGIIEEDIISCTPGDTIKSFTSVQDASGTNGLYSWEKSTDGTTWTTIADATNKDYTPTFMDNVGTTYYRRVYTTDCGTGVSNVLSMTYPGAVDPGSITSVNTIVQYCPGSPVTATLEGHATVQSGETPAIQWQTSADGTEWTDITEATNNEYEVNIEALTSPIHYRYFVTLAGCTTPIYANNVWTYTPYEVAVVNQIATPTDLCPGQTAYTLTADVTAGDGEIVSYNWTGATGTTEEAVVSATLPNCGQTYNYTLQLVDANQCESELFEGSFTVKNPELEVGAMNPVQATLSGLCSFVVPEETVLAESVTAALISDCHLAVTLTDINPAPGSSLTPGITTPVSAVATDMCGHQLEVTVQVISTSPIMSDDAIFDFDDEDVVITLWYGACDTLYAVEAPSFVNNVPEYEGALVLSNDMSTMNDGPIMGRIAPGTYTVNWTITDPCGSYITYPKNYIVRYPNCGDNDPNYEEPYTVTYDGYTYSTVRIGCECWLKENLRTTVDAQGAEIMVAKAYQDDETNLEPYGRLYSWYSAMRVNEGDHTAEPVSAPAKTGETYVQGICPDTWAIPSASQFQDMMSYAGFETRKASSTNQEYWLPGAAGVTPNNGFEAVGAGYYDTMTDHYYNLFAETYFWAASSSAQSFLGQVCVLSHICSHMMQQQKPKTVAGSVRCVKIEPME